MKQNGKITFAGFIFLLLLAYGGFVGVKFIGAKYMQSQIKNEVFDKIGFLRGLGFTPEMGEQAIVEILLKHKSVIFDKEQGVVELTIDSRKSRIKYNFEYKINVDLILFKKIKSIKESREIRSYD
jgi:hypothetical protein